MRIGALRTQFELQMASLSSGATVWTTVATVWGELETLSGAQSLVVNNDRRLTHLIKIRYRTDLTITTGMRLINESRVFNVHGVMNADEQNRCLELYAEESGQLG